MVYDTIFIAEITVTAIFFLFFGLYDNTKERVGFIDPVELNLLAFAMVFMLVSLIGMGVILFLQSLPVTSPQPSYYSSGLLGASIIVVLFSVFLMTIQAFYIFRRLRGFKKQPGTPQSSSS